MGVIESVGKNVTTVKPGQAVLWAGLPVSVPESVGNNVTNVKPGLAVHWSGSPARAYAEYVVSLIIDKSTW